MDLSNQTFDCTSLDICYANGIWQIWNDMELYRNLWSLIFDIYTCTASVPAQIYRLITMCASNIMLYIIVLI